MLSINLLAEESKQKIKDQRIYFLLLKAEAGLLLLLIMVGAIFLSAEKIISDTRNKFSQETSRQVKSSNADYSSKIKEINAKVAVVSQIQSEFSPYSSYLKAIAALIPAGISLSDLEINASAKTLVIRGVATTRDDLLALESNLKDAAFLSSVNIPLEDRLKKDNISINLTLGFDPGKLSL